MLNWSQQPVLRYWKALSSDQRLSDPELLELRQKVAFYDRTLRFQIAEKVTRLLSKNRVVHRVSEALAHRAWKMLK